jgi:excisionase family DNA binding protein
MTKDAKFFKDVREARKEIVKIVGRDKVSMDIDLSQIRDAIRAIMKEELKALIELQAPITGEQLCEWLQISMPTLIRMKKAGEIPHIMVGGSIRYNKQMVIDALSVKPHKK